ncbi:hypothetical protein H4582DRAFT_2126044, partial [Lactarius indigo]
MASLPVHFSVILADFTSQSQVLLARPFGQPPSSFTLVVHEFASQEHTALATVSSGPDGHVDLCCCPVQHTIRRPTILVFTHWTMSPKQLAYTVPSTQFYYTLLASKFSRCYDFGRSQLSQQKKDLDKSIAHYTEAIFLPPVSWAGNWLLNRKLMMGYRNVEEMVDLCRELLASNLSAGFPIAAFVSLVDVVNTEFLRGRSVQLLDEVIECLRDAVKIGPPSSHLLLFALANALCIRILETHSNGDYDEATALLEMVLDHNRSGECPDSIRDLTSSFAAVFAFSRSITFQNPEYSEESTSRLRILLSSSSIDEGLRVQITDILAFEARKQPGELFLEPSAVRGSYSMTRVAEKIQHLEELLLITPPGTERHKECLSHLADWYESKFHRTNEISDLEESIKYNRLLVDDTTHYFGDQRRIIPLCSLHDILLLALEKTEQNHAIWKLVPCLHSIWAGIPDNFNFNGRKIVDAKDLVLRSDSSEDERYFGLRCVASVLRWTQLAEEDSPLAIRFTEINQELEALTIAITPSGRSEMKAVIAQGGGGMDPFGRLVVKRQKLVEEQDVLISQIQSRPGLEGFLKTPSFTALRSAASSGPAILTNHCKWRFDILIVFHKFLPTANDFYDRANELRDGLVKARKHGLDSCGYQDALSSVLMDLYELVGETASPQVLEKPSLLLAAQLDDSPPGVKGEVKVIRSLEAQESPFEASFKLHGDSRLTLLDIVRSRLPDAEFAFLSCCHAAEVTEESIADEALHLTAAMEYCGFRSVVGTMWEMADTDGRDLAKSFYKLLFSNQETDVPYYEAICRSAARCDTEAEGKERNHPGTMGEFRALWRLMERLRLNKSLVLQDFSLWFFGGVSGGFAKGGTYPSLSTPFITQLRLIETQKKFQCARNCQLTADDMFWKGESGKIITQCKGDAKGDSHVPHMTELQASRTILPSPLSVYQPTMGFDPQGIEPSEGYLRQFEIERFTEMRLRMTVNGPFNPNASKLYTAEWRCFA